MIKDHYLFEFFTEKNELDLSNKLNCQNYINFHKPDFIINAGAFTNVDLADNNHRFQLMPYRLFLQSNKRIWWQFIANKF